MNNIYYEIFSEIPMYNFFFFFLGKVTRQKTFIIFTLNLCKKSERSNFISPQILVDAFKHLKFYIYMEKRLWLFFLNHFCY